MSLSASHPNILFVSATDTGVGKTVASAALLQQALAAGQRVAYFKPAQTGVTRDEPGDADFIRIVCASYLLPLTGELAPSLLPTGEVGSSATREPGEGYGAKTANDSASASASNLGSPLGTIPAGPSLTIAEGIRLPEPLAPAIAAARANVAIDVSALLQQAHAIASQCDLLVVEGAGGLLVPLTEDCLMADFAYALGAELVIVARPGLGTLNHTALTLEAARARQMRIKGILISGWPAEPGLAETTNLPRLARMASLLGLIPHLDLDTALPSPIQIPITPAS